jgi:hypothetical protein
LKGVRNVRKLATIDAMSDWDALIIDLGLVVNEVQMMEQWTDKYDPQKNDKAMWDVLYTFCMLKSGEVNSKFQLSNLVKQSLHNILDKWKAVKTEAVADELFCFVRDNIPMLDLMRAGY